MATYVQNGNRIEYTNPSATEPIKNGDVVVLPYRVGVAVTDISAGEAGTVSISEAFAFPTAAEAIPAGTLVYWDADQQAVTATADDNTRVGVAITGKADTEAGTVVVRLE